MFQDNGRSTIYILANAVEMETVAANINHLAWRWVVAFVHLGSDGLIQRAEQRQNDDNSE